MGAITNSSCGSALVDDDNRSDHSSSTNSSADECNGGSGSPDIYKNLGRRTTDSKIEDGGPTISSEEIMNPDAGSSIEENSISPSFEDTSTSKSSKNLEGSKEMNDSQDKTPKKPDKILPCPRCNSMETKFCYYNNYNVNQSRHFCKNCQRYWTAGGTMRNVLIGAGRRKNKASASHHHQLAVSEIFQNPQTGLTNCKHPSMEPNAVVLTFGTHTPLCQSTASAMNVADKSMQDSMRNGFRKPEELRIPVYSSNGENGIDQFSKPSKEKDDANSAMSQEQVFQSFLPQIPFFAATPWPFPWTASQLIPPLTPTTLCPPGFTVPLYPAAYWGCAASNTWNVPWLSQQWSQKDTSSSKPTLVKHSREENTPKSNISEELDENVIEQSREKNLWIPKTLRAHDPRDAAKSSIWRTLGIQNDLADSVRGVQLFKGFASNDVKIDLRGNLPVLQANPAALSRSLNFHETGYYILQLIYHATDRSIQILVTIASLFRASTGNLSFLVVYTTVRWFGVLYIFHMK